MSAAEVLRAAIEKAPGMYVAEDGYGELRIWNEGDVLLDGYGNDETQAALRLIGLLLAAAPHLAGMLNARENPEISDDTRALLALDAIDALAADLADKEDVR